MTTQAQLEQRIADYLADVLRLAMTDVDDGEPRHFTVQNYDPARHEAVVAWDADQSCTGEPETTYVDLAALDKAFDRLAGSFPTDWRDDDDRMVTRQDGHPLNLTVIGRDHLYGSYCEILADALTPTDCRALVEIVAFGTLVFTDL